MKFKLLVIACLFSMSATHAAKVQPAANYRKYASSDPVKQIDPTGSVADAKMTIRRYIREHRQIVYFDRWKGFAEFVYNDMAYVYPGMQLAEHADDFMKNHDILVTRHSIKNTTAGKYIVQEEVTYPVWSAHNGGHVLRSVKINSVVPKTSINGQPGYRGIDGLLHYSHIRAN